MIFSVFRLDEYMWISLCKSRFLSFSHMIMIIVCDVKICVCTAATLLFVNTGTNRVTSVDTLI